jgi:hypothetical protein
MARRPTPPAEEAKDELKKALGGWGDFLGDDAIKEIARRLAEPDDGVRHLVEVRSARFETPPEREPLKKLAAKEREIASTAQQAPTAPLASPNDTKPRTDEPPKRRSSSEPLKKLAAKEREIASTAQQAPTAPLTPPNDDTKPRTDDEPPTAQSSAQVGEVESPETTTRRSSSEAVIKAAIYGEYVYSCVALLLGLSAIIGGSILCIYGVTGHTSFTASLLGLSTNLNDAAPGVVLFVIGLFMIWATRPKVKLGDLVG